MVPCPIGPQVDGFEIGDLSAVEVSVPAGVGISLSREEVQVATLASPRTLQQKSNS